MNKKGNVIIGLALSHVSSAVLTATIFKMAFIALAVTVAWHIPAWEKAKDNHTEDIYQSQQMWPQQIFYKIPNTEITYKSGNGGNFSNGIQR